MQVDSSFVRIDAGWTASYAAEVVSSVHGAVWVVVHRRERGRESFYVFPRAQVTAGLAGKHDQKIDRVLDLAHPAKVIAPSHAPVADALVVGGGRIVGISRPRQTQHAAPVSHGQHAAPVSHGQHAAPVTHARPPGHVMGMAPGGLAMTGDTVQGPPPAVEPSAEPSAEPPADQQRELVGSVASEVTVGGTASLIVRITAGDVPGGQHFAAHAGQQIDLVVQVAGAVELVGAAEASLTVANTDAAHQFKIRGKAAGPGTITILAFDSGNAIASVTLSVTVVDHAADPSPETGSGTIISADAQADLSLYIFEDKTARTYTMRATTADADLGLNLAPYGPIQLDTSVEEFFTTFFADIEAILRSGKPPAECAADLGAKGSYLFEKIVPQPLRAKLWDLRGRIKSIQIQSEEPWVPWELCKLSGGEKGQISEAGFLSEEFVVTRWFPGLEQYPHLTASAIGLVAPADSGLAAAQAERNFIQRLAAKGRTVTAIDAVTTALRQALSAGTYDCLHFVGHGKYDANDPDRSMILLEQTRTFAPEDLSGAVANLGAKKPLVFLNACEIGRSGTALGGTAGWPQAFLQAGAGAFIGPYWKVGDGSAASFVQTFYKQLLDHGKSVGAAAHEARLAAQSASDPTWLSYVVFAHPSATVR